jgi:hypothetical protein
MKHRIRIVVVASLLACTSRRAAADEATTLAAEASFAEGVQLMKADRCQEALPKFQESQRFDPASGTLLDLAYCEAQLGRVASAWLSYRQALSLAEAQHKPQHERLAREQADKLAPQVPYLELVVNDDVHGALGIELDNTLLPKATWSVPVPLDPGAHSLIAVVDGKAVWQRVLRLTPGERATLVLPSVAPVERSSPAPAPAPLPPKAANPPYLAAASVGLAILSLTAGAIAGSVATAPAGGSNRAQRQADLARRVNYATAANVCFVAGGVFSATAVITFVWR